MNIRFLSGLALVLGISGCAASAEPEGSVTAGTAGAMASAAQAGTAGSAGTGSGGNAAGGTNSAGSGGQPGGSAGTPALMAGAGAGGSAAGTAGAAGSVNGGSAGANEEGEDHIPADYMGTPFGGQPQVIPGKLETELYDLGGEGIAFHDTMGVGNYDACGLTRDDATQLACTHGAGDYSDKLVEACTPAPDGDVYLGYIADGEWYKYTVTVLESGTYVISGHNAVANGMVSVSFDFTEEVSTGPVALPSTEGCDNYEAYHIWAMHPDLAEITLPAGKYVMTLTMVSVGMNLEGFTFTKK